MRAFCLLVLLVLLSCQNPAKSKIVGIQPYSGFPKDRTDTIAHCIASFYKIEILILPQKELYKSAFINVKSPRYRADSIIRFQKEFKPANIDYIIGLTTKDISTTKKEPSGKTKSPAYKYNDWGIMGLGYCPGTSCMVSDFRLKTKNEKNYFSRLKKVAIHEMGHNMGLPHCPDKQCVMTDAVESIATIDHANLALCNSCKKRLRV